MVLIIVHIVEMIFVRTVYIFMMVKNTVQSVSYSIRSVGMARMSLPRMFRYVDYKTESYGDSRAVEVGHLTLYFSGEVCIAFKYRGELTVCMNIYGSTVGRHIAAVEPDPSKRVNPVMFEERLLEILRSHKLIDQSDRKQRLQDNLVEEVLADES